MTFNGVMIVDPHYLCSSGASCFSCNKLVQFSSTVLSYQFFSSQYNVFTILCSRLLMKTGSKSLFLHLISLALQQFSISLSLMLLWHLQHYPSMCICCPIFCVVEFQNIFYRISKVKIQLYYFLIKRMS